MIVYDVVQMVIPGAHCSYRAGRNWIYSFDRRSKAEEYVSRCNLFRLVDGIAYAVEPHDETCPCRAGRPPDASPDVTCDCATRAPAPEEPAP
jgi:hypothetical protein